MILTRANASSRRALMVLELLVVMALILVLFVMYFGGGGRKVSKQRNFAACAKNLQFIHTALLTYSADYNDKFPTAPLAKMSEDALSVLVPKYISQTSPFICPSSKDRALPEGQSFAKKKISYGYLMGLSRTNDPSQWIMSDEQVNTNQKQQGDRVFANTNSPPGDNHGGFGGNLLMLDGTVKNIGPTAPYSLTFTNARYLNPQPFKDN